MPTYMLRYTEDFSGVEKAVAFEGETPAQALKLAKDECPGRSGRLYEGDRLICTISKVGESDFWFIGSADHAVE